MSTVILLTVSFLAVGISFFKDKKKTKKSLMMAKGMFLNTAGSIIGILMLIGLMLGLIPPEVIKDLLGNSSLFLSGFYGAVIGAVTIIPAFIAFPLAASLFESGANLVGIAAFITTLTMVGIATLPIEIEHFGKKFALVRNGLSFILALLIALGMVIIL
jgi:uncharacterized membrane protein YraQ (UPF0718 family)